MRIYTYILIVLFFVAGKAYSQTESIADEKFLAFLKQNYPTTINDSDELIIAEAETVLGAFNCSNMGISDLDGVQYFTSINRLYAANNLLTELPDISTLENLLTLHVAENELTQLSDLGDLIMLQEIYAYDNKLTVFPDISSLTDLETLVLFTNSIDSIPSYNSLSHLKKLDIGGNPISDLTFLKQLKLIEDLRLWGLRISETPNVSELVYLQNLNLGTNYLTTPPDVSTLSQLEILYLNNNQFKELPSGLLNLTELKEVHLENNQLSFDDLIPITSYNSYSNIFSFFPQMQVDMLSPNAIKFSQDVKLLVDLNDNVNNLEYRWFKDNAFIQKTGFPVLLINDFEEENNGVYYCEISSPSITGFYLKSYNTELSGSVCVEESSVSITKNQNCENGNSIEILASEIAEYQLISDIDTLSNSSGYFSSLRNTDYALLLHTSACFQNYPTTISFSDLNCDELLITPDGDGINDSYYFEENATVEVFNKAGQKVSEFSAPKRWGGEGNNGKLPSGYYFISINGSRSVKMSIIY